MMELALIFMGGALGSSHCLGMCGGFALAIGSGTTSLWSNAGRQLVYTLGRVFTYAVLGGLVGYGGFRLTRGLPPFVNGQAVLALLAGVLLVIQAALAMGWIRWPGTKHLAPSCAGAGILSGFLQRPGWTNVFLAGLMTGFLPCGLVYAFLALAGSSGSLLDGLLRMAAFGAGTAPLMIAFGSGVSLLNLSSRRHVYRIAAWCVLITGLVSIGRGMGFLPWFLETPLGGCPMCK
ncbi:MAG: sulfite exporter TauE/SafE family protein [Pirellulales bacterium]